MKKIKGILSAIIAMMIAVTMLAGCGGGGEATGYEGKYISVSGEMMGMELTGEDIAGWAIELNNGGKGNMEIDGETENIKWTLEGETITVNVDGEEMTGTFEDDKLVFDDILGSGMKLTFAKEGER